MFKKFFRCVLVLIVATFLICADTSISYAANTNNEPTFILGIDKKSLPFENVHLKLDEIIQETETKKEKVVINNVIQKIIKEDKDRKENEKREQDEIMVANSIPAYSISSQESITLEELYLLSDLVMAESENQEWEAQYRVACVVLRRVDGKEFPDTIKDVIYQKSQFTCAWNGRLDKVKGKANDSCIKAVQAAIENNVLPNDCYYFTSNGYLKGTVPYDKVDDMYFSSQKK